MLQHLNNELMLWPTLNDSGRMFDLPVSEMLAPGDAVVVVARNIMRSGCSLVYTKLGLFYVYNIDLHVDPCIDK